MHRQALPKTFPTTSLEHQEEVLQQIVQVFKAMSFRARSQDMKGAFDAKGEVISGATTIWFGGPFDTFKDMYAQIFKKPLALAETTKLVNAWKETSSLRQRLRTFQSRDMEKVLKIFTITRRTLVHGDLGE
jgi:hypothetical protein